MESRRNKIEQMIYWLDDLTSFLWREIVIGREEIEGTFPSIRFSLFSIVINRVSFIPSSSLIAASVFGIAIGGDGKNVSDSNLSTK